MDLLLNSQLYNKSLNLTNTSWVTIHNSQHALIHSIFMLIFISQNGEAEAPCPLVRAVHNLSYSTRLMDSNIHPNHLIRGLSPLIFVLLKIPSVAWSHCRQRDSCSSRFCLFWVISSDSFPKVSSKFLGQMLWSKPKNLSTRNPSESLHCQESATPSWQIQRQSWYMIRCIFCLSGCFHTKFAFDGFVLYLLSTYSETNCMHLLFLSNLYCIF